MGIHTSEFEGFILPARAKPQLWRFLAGLALFGIIYVGFVLGLVRLIEVLHPEGITAAEIDMNTRPSMIVGLFSFTGAIIGVWAAARFLHNRKFHTLIGPSRTLTQPKPTILRNFAIAAGLVFAVQATMMIIAILIFGAVPNQPLSMVLLYLPLGLVLLLVQTGAEEFLFRGYIMQQLAVRFASPVIWLVLPSVVFGLIHYDPENMGNVAVYILFTLTLTGLAWADLTRITGNLGAAWGWHFMNNVMVLNVMTIRGTMEGFAWKLTPYGPDDMTPFTFVPDIIMTIGLWVILRRLLRPKSIPPAVYSDP